jgi:spore coat protein A
MGITRLNTLMGLAGFWIVRDQAEDALLSLPRGDLDVPIMLGDCSLTADAQLWVPPVFRQEMFFDLITANGVITPYMPVKRTLYRLRLLNAANYRPFNLSLSAAAVTMTLIATDGGLLARPQAVTHLVITPGERAEVLIDFSLLAASVTSLELLGEWPLALGGMYTGRGTFPVLQFRVQGDSLSPMPAIPTKLSAPHLPHLDRAQQQRTFELRTYSGAHTCPHSQWRINGLTFDDLTGVLAHARSHVASLYSAPGTHTIYVSAHAL